jgi:hypothetical protein
LDQAIQWFSNRINFPNLKQIVVVGHSAGGQMAQRYAVVGAPLDLSGELSLNYANVHHSFIMTQYLSPTMLGTRIPLPG